MSLFREGFDGEIVVVPEGDPDAVCRDALQRFVEMAAKGAKRVRIVVRTAEGPEAWVPYLKCIIEQNLRVSIEVVTEGGARD